MKNKVSYLSCICLFSLASCGNFEATVSPEAEAMFCEAFPDCCVEAKCISYSEDFCLAAVETEADSKLMHFKDLTDSYYVLNLNEGEQYYYAWIIDDKLEYCTP